MLTNSVSVSYLHRFDVTVPIINVSCAYCGCIQGECSCLTKLIVRITEVSDHVSRYHLI